MATRHPNEALYNELLALMAAKGQSPYAPAASETAGNLNMPVDTGNPYAQPMWDRIPGIEGQPWYLPASGSGDTEQAMRIKDYPAAVDWLNNQGMSWQVGSDGPRQITGAWVAGQDGKPLWDTSSFNVGGDQKFMNAAMAAGAVTGANIGLASGAFGGGNALTGGAALPGSAAEQAAMMAANAPVGNAGGLSAWQAAQGAGGFGGMSAEMMAANAPVGNSGGLSAWQAAQGAAGAAGGGMDWGSLAGNLVGAGLQSYTAKQATDAQRDAARDATALQRDMYNQTAARNQPFVEGGTTAFNALLSRLGLSGDPNAEGYGTFGRVPTAEDVMAEPGYQFGRDQGELGLQRQMNMRGMSGSGAQLKAAMRFNNDYASGQYGNAFNRSQSAQQQAYNQLGNVANMGQNSANLTGAAGANFGNNAAQNMLRGGDASAMNNLAQGSIWGNALNQGISMYRNRQKPGD